MRSDGLLPYEIMGEPGKSQVTGHAGLLPYIDGWRHVPIAIGIRGERRMVGGGSTGIQPACCNEDTSAAGRVKEEAAERDSICAN